MEGAAPHGFEHEHGGRSSLVLVLGAQYSQYHVKEQMMKKQPNEERIARPLGVALGDTVAGPKPKSQEEEDPGSWPSSLLLLLLLLQLPTLVFRRHHPCPPRIFPAVSLLLHQH